MLELLGTAMLAAIAGIIKAAFIPDFDFDKLDSFLGRATFYIVSCASCFWFGMDVGKRPEWADTAANYTGVAVGIAFALVVTSSVVKNTVVHQRRMRELGERLRADHKQDKH